MRGFPEVDKMNLFILNQTIDSLIKVTLDFCGEETNGG